MSVTTGLVYRLLGYLKWADEAVFVAAQSVADHEYYLPRPWGHPWAG